MGMRYSSTLRANRAQEIIDLAGTNPKLRFYNGTVPAGGGTPSGTLLATVVCSGALGTRSGAVITLNSTLTQTNSGHSNGTPTFCRITDASDGFILDVDIGSGAGNMQFTGTISTNVNVVLNASTITQGNA